VPLNSSIHSLASSTQASTSYASTNGGSVSTKFKGLLPHIRRAAHVTEKPIRRKCLSKNPFPEVNDLEQWAKDKFESAATAVISVNQDHRMAAI
jgi:hypothetical protein